MMCAAMIRAAQGRTDCSIARLIPLEVSSDVASSSSTNNANHQMVPMGIQLEILVNHDNKQQIKVETK